MARERRARRDAEAARSQADAARNQAEIDKQDALKEAAKSKQVTLFLEDMLGGVEPGVALGRDTTLMREILGRAVKRLDLELTNQPAVQADLKFRLGKTYRTLYRFKEAESMHRQALAIRNELFGAESEAATDVMNELVKALISEKKNAEAESLIRRTLAVRQRLLGDESVKAANSMFLLGVSLLGERRWADSESELRQSLAMNRKLLGDKDTAIGEILFTLGKLCYDQGKCPRCRGVLPGSH